MSNSKYGFLTQKYLGLKIENSVMKSRAGYYIGTADESGPVSRESLEYFKDEAEAQAALESGIWTQKPNP